MTAQTFRLYRCNKCEDIFAASEQDPDIRLLRRSMRCPNSMQCGGRISVKSMKDLDMREQVKAVPAIELYQATLGLGLSTERKVGPTDVRKLLLGRTIRAIKIEKSGDPNKSLLFSLTTDEGKTIHVAPSTKGVVIYKVTE